MMTKKGTCNHAIIAIFSCIYIIGAAVYYSITQYGAIATGSQDCLRVFVLVIALFLLLEAGQWIYQQINRRVDFQNRIGKAYVFFFVLCLFISLIGYIVWTLFHNQLYFTRTRTIGILLTGCVVFGIGCAEIQIAKHITKSKIKGWGFSLKDISIAVICTMLFCFSFIPVIADYFERSYPFSSVAFSFLNVEDRSGERSFLDQITSDMKVEQTFVCEAYK